MAKSITMEVTMEVRVGPVMRSAMDVLDLVAELLPLIPEWHQEERLELAARTMGLAETMKQNLRGQ